MPFDVELPDGRVLKDIPDGTTKAQIVAKLGSNPDIAENGLPAWLDEASRVADKAVRGGVMAIPNLIRHGGNYLESIMPTPDSTKITIPESVVKAYDELTTPRQPKTEAGKYLGAVGEGAVGALAGPGGLVAPVRSLVTGAGAGAGSETAAHLFGDNALSRILGGLAGGGTTSLLTAAKTNKESLAREALKDVRPQDLATAKQRMIEAQAAGIPINLSQAMPRASNVDAYVDTLANSKHGVQTAEMLRNQPAQAAFGAEEQMANLPGQIRMPQVLANNAQEGATKAISNGVQAAGQAWQKMAPQGSLIPEQMVGQLDNRLALMAKQYPNTAAADLFNDVRSRLKAPSQSPTGGSPLLGPNGQPLNPPAVGPKYLTDALQVKGAIDDALENFGKRNLNTPGLDSKLLRRAQEVREMFNGLVDIYAPKLSAANQAYNAVMEGTVDPLKKSVVGRIAGRSGASDVVESPQARLFSVFDKGTVPGATSSEILTLERSLREAGHAADFQDAAKTWLAGKVSTALKSTDNRMPEDFAGRLRAAFGDPRQLDQTSKGFQDTLAGLARSQGVPAAPYVKGFEHFMEIVSDAARRPGNVRGTTPGAIVQNAGEGVGRHLGAVNFMTPLRQPLLAWSRWLEQDSLSAMDRLLTSPEGVDTLIKLGKQPRMSHTAISTMATFLGTSAAASNPPDITQP